MDFAKTKIIEMIMNDLYFTEKYGILHERVEKGQFKTFDFARSYGQIKHSFILRKIPILVDGQQWFDITTPYGYGGPVIEWCEKEQESTLVNEFSFEFNDYCKSNKIVSEFVRFHPLAGNAQQFESIYHSKFERKTVGTNLTLKDPIGEEFSSSCRRNIKKALNGGVKYEVITSPTQMDEFTGIYYETMGRNSAASYYYFPEEYFQNLREFFHENIIFSKASFAGKTIAMGLNIFWDKTIHVLLSGTLNKYLSLSPAYVLRYALTLWGIEHGFELIHHGGGKTNDKSDTLLSFKKKFGKNTEFNFCTGSRIWNDVIYQYLCAITNKNPNSSYFPPYRERK